MNNTSHEVLFTVLYKPIHKSVSIEMKPAE